MASAGKRVAPKADKVEKTGRKKKFLVSVSGLEARYFVSVPKKSELRKLRAKGLPTEGLETLPDTLSGEEETTWISPSSVVATVDGREIPIHHARNAPASVRDYRGKDVVFFQQRVDGADYQAEVLADSMEDIRVEISLDEHWTLPDGREIEVYILEIASPAGAELEFETGGGGDMQAELITADGASLWLEEEHDPDSGEVHVKVS